MIAELGGLEALKKEAHRNFVRLLARRLTEALDTMAGPRGLSRAEQDIQQLCRDRFELYDPTCERQIRFVSELDRLATAFRPHPHPRGETRAPEPPVAPGPGDGEPTGSDPHPEPKARRSPQLRPQFRRGGPAVPPSPRRPATRRREEWAGYLSRWRGSAADEDGDPYGRGEPASQAA